MFTGVIEEIGTVAGIERGRGLRLGIRARQVLEGLKVGDSIAVSGPCLTVEAVSGNRFWASLLPETAERTTLGGLRQGDRVNLERPLRMGDRLSGHLVAGHVDGMARVASVQERGETRLVGLECPEGLERYLVDRGSVALDGVSLTVVAPAGRRLSVALVGATLAATTLGELKAGDRVNLEADLLAKHIERLLAMREGGDSGKVMEWLAEAEPYE
ncbi:MAG: riboflavin synthase [Armatimonadetes bacterium]|nr:riboflavin synthase [Armatimonadota bacterium]